MQRLFCQHQKAGTGMLPQVHRGHETKYQLKAENALEGVERLKMAYFENIS